MNPSKKNRLTLPIIFFAASTCHPVLLKLWQAGSPVDVLTVRLLGDFIAVHWDIGTAT